MTKKISEKTKKFSRVLPYILIIGGLIGLYCAFTLISDEIHLLKNPHYQLNCNIDPIISCGNVMQTKEAAVFGFSNPILGLAAFAVLITVGVAMKAGAIFKRWFWLGLEAGGLLGVIFVHWLFYESVYHINALCPYCMVVWVTTITTFWYLTLYNIENGHIVLPDNKFFNQIKEFIVKHHIDILILWLLIIATLILKHFWYYYKRYI